MSNNKYQEHDFKVGEEVVIYRIVPEQEHFREQLLGKSGVIIRPREHNCTWIAIQGVTDKSGNQLWVHPAGVRRLTKLDKTLR